MGNIPIERVDDFDIQPLASASLAQVHTARLKENGKEVVIKVIRPDILPVIKADMKLIYRLARWVPRLLPDGRRLRPLEVVREYEKTLIDELNLLRESANAIRLRRNFEDSPMLYVPEVYSDYCSQNMMVMERIYGIPVSDVTALEKQGTEREVAGRTWRAGLLYSGFPRQLLHADMHPGNVLSAMSTRKILNTSASTAVLSAR
ncbi:AarF/UbiB family protein [Enterobacter hormaechei]